MREFNKINPSLWGSQKFRKLSQEDKMIYLYFLTSPHSNSAGCYRCPIGYMMSDLGIDEKGLRKGIERVCHTLLISFNIGEEMVFLGQWFRFNPPANPNHAKKVLEDIKALSDCDVKFVCLQEFKGCLLEKKWEIPEEIDTLLKGYRKGIGNPSERVSPLDQTRLDQTKPDKDEDEDETFTVKKEKVNDFELAVSAWNEIAQEYNLSKIQKLTDERKQKLSKRLKDCGGIDGWNSALLKIAQSDFCLGKKTEWKINFDFLLKESSFIKLLEGAYDNNQNNQPPKSGIPFAKGCDAFGAPIGKVEFDDY